MKEELYAFILDWLQSALILNLRLQQCAIAPDKRSVWININLFSPQKDKRSKKNINTFWLKKIKDTLTPCLELWTAFCKLVVFCHSLFQYFDDSGIIIITLKHQAKFEADNILKFLFSIFQGK